MMQIVVDALTCRGLGELERELTNAFCADGAPCWQMPPKCYHVMSETQVDACAQTASQAACPALQGRASVQN